MQHQDDAVELPLTSRQAFLAMSEFVWRFACRAGDDLLTLVGDTELMGDGEPTDPAAWDDWGECVRAVLRGGALRQGPDD